MSWIWEILGFNLRYNYKKNKKLVIYDKKNIKITKIPVKNG